MNLRSSVEMRNGQVVASYLFEETPLSGITLHHMLRKKQHKQSDGVAIFEQFNSLAA